MEKIIKRYSNDTGKMEQYKWVEVEKKACVKGENFTMLHEYYQRISDGELFELFEDPDRNIDKAYTFYRRKHHLLSSDEIKKIRNTYRLSIRDFSSMLGISYANLSSIENGSIQSKYIDSLLRLAQDPYAFRELVFARSEDIASDVYARLMKELEELILYSYIEHKKVAEEVRGYHLDIRNNMIRMTNKIVLNYKGIEGNPERKTSWKESNIVTQKGLWKSSF
ncbi:hypothetical protein [Enterococcus olivae]